MESALIGLGSNLGDRAGFIRKALEQLAAAPGTRRGRVSELIETEPVGDPSDGDLGGKYLNGAAEVITELDPRDLLLLCLAIEESLGRKRSPRARNSPRTIDLDLLLFGDRAIDEPGLVVPHPRMLERGFVLGPLAQIAPERRHPISGRTILEHWLEWKSCHDHHP